MSDPVPGAGKLGWWLLLAIAAVCAFGTQLDRQARKDVRYVDYVPKAFRNFAQATVAARAVQEGRSKWALRESARLLAKRPAPAENLELYALAAANSGDDTLAEKAFVASAGRGWRAPLAQYFVVDAALREDRPDLAADRLFALWILKFRSPEIARALDRVIAEPEGRQTIAKLLETNWWSRRTYFYWGATNLAPENHTAVIATVTARGIALPCTMQGNLMRRYLRSGEPEAARQVWIGDCENGRAVDPADRTFYPNASDGSTGWLGWFAENGAEIRETGDSRNLGYILEWNGAPTGYSRIANRLVAMQPGRYRLTLKTADRGANDLPLRLDVICLAAGGKMRSLKRLASGSPDNAIAIPADGCPVQELRLHAPSGSGTITRLEFARE